MLKHDVKIGVAALIVTLAFSCACVIGSWLLNVYIIVKTAKWMGWQERSWGGAVGC